MQGNFYGTTSGGGSFNGGAGFGTVFELTTQNNFVTLWQFHGTTDGSQPMDGLILDPSGNLYGTTFNGGAYSMGVVFELTP